ncbi:MAG: glycoside hydrolase family 113 [Thermoproteota archaeon]
MTSKLLLLSVFILMLTSQLSKIPGAVRIESSFLKVPVFQKGMSYVSWPPNFDSRESADSLYLLKLTNTEWVAVCFFWYQDSINSIRIYPYYNSPSEESLIRVIDMIHELGMKVMLKPMVDPRDGHWRGEIPPSKEWFESYASFINRWAEFSQKHGLDILCIGCEFNANDIDEVEWRKIVAGIRERYSGPITYAANHDNYKKVKWWDVLDYVGIDAYFPLTARNDPDFEDLKITWKRIADEIEEWASIIGKPVIFTEIGYRSCDGTNIRPWEWSYTAPLDLDEQADCYEAAFQALWNRSWFYGFYWWNWETNPVGDRVSTGYTPQNKPAEEVVRRWYSKEPHEPIFLSSGKKTFSPNEEAYVKIVTWPNYTRKLLAEYYVVSGTRTLGSGKMEVETLPNGTAYINVGKYSLGIYFVKVVLTDTSRNKVVCETTVKIIIDPPDEEVPVLIGYISILIIVIATAIFSLKNKLAKPPAR